MYNPSRILGIRVIFCLLTLSFGVGCSEKEDMPETVYEVPQEFESIVEQFRLEALSRDYPIETNNLIIEYDSSMESTICGSCNSTSKDLSVQKIISINPNACWINSYQKEALIFHELGHCWLGRLHEEAVLTNGDPKSMMVANNISVYSPCVYSFGDIDDCNFVFKRAYYLDELFDPDVSAPEWANP